MTAADAHRAILAVWRVEQPRLITSLARMLRDVPLAEELTQEALLAALERWPQTGVPERPGAWLMATAKRRGLDHLRRDRMLGRKHAMIVQDMEEEQQAMPDLESGLAYETPRGEELSQRLGAVLEVVYLIFNEGYTAARGEDLLRPQLCNEALRLGRILVSIAPHEPEAHGLLALMELNASRTAARTDAAGTPILMLDQDRALWDLFQIRRGMQALGQAWELGGGGGFYVLQAAIIACHAQARTADETDWPRIAGFYAQLSANAGSPVIELNRAVAVGMAEGPQAGLVIVDRLVDEPALKDYHLLSSVRGDLLHRLGRHQEASAAFQAAAALTGNRRERELLLRRASEAAQAVQPST
jgi:predicted RNA polymerase sigma factor